uniref:Venom peptide meuPep31 n=1 Tax=Mesobuthus eupeus TaxID=34648 RepID=A0A146CJ04_MESEU|nr:venom peptide meuPep31 [Mesobuthus eupeus]
MMLILLLVVALADGIFGQINNDRSICDASDDQKSRFIECMRREYEAFGYALSCSRYLNVRAMDDFVDLSCEKLKPSNEEKAKYSECINTSINVRNAKTEDQLQELLKKCTVIAISK